MSSNLYRVLGVTNNASKQAIKQAYRKLAIQFHPDKHTQSPKHVQDSVTKEFRRVTGAYETLVDDQKRAYYDLTRRKTEGGAAHSEPHGHHGGYSNHNSSNDYGGLGIKLDILTCILTCTGTSIRSIMQVLDTAKMKREERKREALSERAKWERNNPEKSFDEYMKSVQNAKAMAQLELFSCVLPPF